MVGKSAGCMRGWLLALTSQTWLFTPSLLRAQPPCAIPHVVQDLRRKAVAPGGRSRRDGVNLSAYRRYAPLAYLTRLRRSFGIPLGAGKARLALPGRTGSLALA